MKRFAVSRVTLLALLLGIFCWPVRAQTPEVRFVSDTLVVQAEGTYEAEPDLATLEFQISTQEKELKTAYDKASKSLNRIAELAERNGLSKNDMTTGALTVYPFYDEKHRARSYSVSGHVQIRLRDFSKIGGLLDESIQDGITEFRSLTYSLADEEAAKQHAVAEAMRHAIDRSTVAVEQKGQKLGALRSVSLDVRQVVGVARWDTREAATFVMMQPGVNAEVGRQRAAVAPPPPPPVQPGKIAVTATVQCMFQIL